MNDDRDRGVEDERPMELLAPPQPGRSFGDEVLQTNSMPLELFGNLGLLGDVDVERRCADDGIAPITNWRERGRGSPSTAAAMARRESARVFWPRDARPLNAVSIPRRWASLKAR
jgi:hypothetical protein